MHSAAYDIIQCPLVQLLFLCIASKQVNILWNFYHCLVDHHPSFSVPNVAIFWRGLSNVGRVQKDSNFRPEMVQDVTIVTIECQQELVCNQSNGAISNDWVTANLDFSRSWYYLMSNNFKTIEDRSVVTMADWWEVVYDISTGATLSDLEWPLTQNSRACHYLTFSISEMI